MDAIQWNTYYLLRVNGNELDPPTPLSRPGQTSGPATVSLGDFVASLKE